MAQSRKNITKKAALIFKQNREYVNSFLDSYVLSRLIHDEIHNDLGASQTIIERRNKRLIKRALPEGEEKLREEILWYLRYVETPVGKHLPQINAYCLDEGNVFIDMKYYSFPNFRSIIINESNPKSFIEQRWAKIFHILKKYFFIKKRSAQTPEDYVQNVHFNKLRSRLNQTVKKEKIFKKFLAKPTVTINGETFLNVSTIIPAIEQNTKIINKLTPPCVYESHGDVHTNNILCGLLSSDMILLDCRGKNVDGSQYYDAAYDLAKIFHDVRGKYSLIEKNQYTLFISQEKELEIEYDFLNKEGFKSFEQSREMVESLMKKNFSSKDLQYRIDFTESMLYLTMLIFHMEPKSEAIMCYVKGIEQLNYWLKKYHPSIYKELLKK